MVMVVVKAVVCNTSMNHSGGGGPHPASSFVDHGFTLELDAMTGSMSMHTMPAGAAGGRENERHRQLLLSCGVSQSRVPSTRVGGGHGGGILNGDARERYVFIFDDDACGDSCEAASGGGYNRSRQMVIAIFPTESVVDSGRSASLALHHAVEVYKALDVEYSSTTSKAAELTAVEFFISQPLQRADAADRGGRGDDVCASILVAEDGESTTATASTTGGSTVSTVRGIIGTARAPSTVIETDTTAHPTSPGATMQATTTPTATTTAPAPKIPPEEVRGAVLSAAADIAGRSVSPDEPLVDAGVDSIAAVELVMTLQSTIGVSLDVPEVATLPTVAAIAENLMAAVAAAAAANAASVVAAAAAASAETAAGGIDGSPSSNMEPRSSIVADIASSSPTPAAAVAAATTSNADGAAKSTAGFGLGDDGMIKSLKPAPPVPASLFLGAPAFGDGPLAYMRLVNALPLGSHAVGLLHVGSTLTFFSLIVIYIPLSYRSFDCLAIMNPVQHVALTP